MRAWALLIAAVLFILAVVAFAAEASAQPRTPCGELAKLQAQLLAKYGESPVGAGIRTDGQLFQVYASRSTGTWTVLVTKPGGPTCLIAAGNGWHDDPIPPVGDPA